MTAGRSRTLVCPAAFLGLALLLAGGSARAQERGSHRMLPGSSSTLTPEQFKAALSRLAGGDGAGLDPFKDQILDLMKKQAQREPQFNPEDIQKALKILEKHPELLEQAKQIARERQTDPGRPGKLNPDDLNKLFQVKPGEPFQLPDPKDFKLPDFPNGGPGPMVVPPKGMGDPNGGPVPPVPPAGNPNAGPVPPPDNPGGPPAPPKVKVDPNEFLKPPDEDPRAKSLDTFTSIWERNIGSLDEMPEVKRALFDLVGGDGFDFDLKDGNGNSIWDLLKNGDGGGSGFGDMFGDLGSGGFGNWEFPSVGSWFRDWGGGWGGGSSSSSSSSSWWNSGSSSSPRTPSSSGWGSGGGGWGIGGLGGAWVPFLLLLLVIVGVVVWLKVKDLQGRAPALALAGGLGPWPVDPRAINTREDVVKAFEYLSVLICGPAAKNWTHGTIAESLADLAKTHGETASLLARLYELARYAPLDEPLTRDELVEARKLVCALAGVSY